MAEFAAEQPDDISADLIEPMKRCSMVLRQIYDVETQPLAAE